LKQTGSSQRSAAEDTRHRRWHCHWAVTHYHSISYHKACIYWFRTV